MKRKDLINGAGYVAGFFVIVSALLLTFFLVLTMLGWIHPRQTRITIQTLTLSKTYDGTTLSGGMPQIVSGRLHEGHRLDVTQIPEVSRVGEYPNQPQICILDQTGADVTDQYAVTWDLGTITVFGRPITLTCPKQVKSYDGEPLTSKPAVLTLGELLPGHSLETQSGNSRVLPGTERIRPVYRILTGQGNDVTDQYAIQEDMGDLTVLPVSVTVATDSASKTYDGTPLTNTGWQQAGGTLLKGHTLQMEMTAVLEDVGTALNEGVAHIVDRDGKDVTGLYEIEYLYGQLEICPISVFITTGSDRKVYDGTALACEQWEMTGGALRPGDSLWMGTASARTLAGTSENAITFIVGDADGRDVTYRYSFTYTYGTLTVQPRAITIRTDSAKKVYDGTALRCDSFQIIKGSLCPMEQVKLVGVTLEDVGYSENYVVDCTIYREDFQGNLTDVSACYRISYDYGILEMTEN